MQFNTQYCRISSSSYSFDYREKQILQLTIMFQQLESLLFDNIALIQRSFCGYFGCCFLKK